MKLLTISAVIMAKTVLILRDDKMTLIEYKTFDDFSCNNGQDSPNLKIVNFLHLLTNKNSVMHMIFSSFPNKPWSSCLQCKSFENTTGKGEIACDEQFLLFPPCFLPVWRTFCHFH